MSTPMAVAVGVLVLGAVALLCRADVRLVLAVSGVALFGAAGKWPAFLTEFTGEMVNPRTVVPICSAWGFARVLKLTECDRQLVLLLLRPMRAARWLLVPGGVTVCFVVNTAVVSQTGTASIVGPLLVPLLLAAGFGRVTAGSVLLLGSSMGGELFNPGAVELATLAPLVGMTPQQAVAKVTPYNLLACGVALAAFWAMAVRWPASVGEEAARGGMAFGSIGRLEESQGLHAREGASAAPVGDPVGPAAVEGTRVNVVKAIVPLVPLVILFMVPALRRHGLPVPAMPGHVEIAAAMLVGVVAAAVTAPRCANGLTAAFFEGAGFAYAHVVSFIVVATTFAAGIAATGLIERAASSLAGAPAALTVASAALPWSMATVTGTGIGTGVPLIKILVPLAQRSGTDAVEIGSLVAIFAQFGRTTSPVAPVVILCATFAGVNPLKLLRRVAPALLLGGGVLVGAVLLGW
jgi:DcuC family C4-dicarboxylate transporter